MSHNHNRRMRRCRGLHYRATAHIMKSVFNQYNQFWTVYCVIELFLIVVVVLTSHFFIAISTFLLCCWSWPCRISLGRYACVFVFIYVNIFLLYSSNSPCHLFDGTPIKGTRLIVAYMYFLTATGDRCSSFIFSFSLICALQDWCVAHN